ncbi:MAG: hypothetical protein Q8R15_03700 [Candidatus Micrarchaeota archaeon]|nr:hypothetical protein [Candidatus Micrarchaeota archaeon]
MLQKEIIVGLENVSQLGNSDKATFEKMLKLDNSMDYSDCWAYLIQSTFFGGFKFFDAKNFVAFTTFNPASTVFCITKAVGSNPRQAVLSLARVLKERSGEKVIVKNLSEYDHEFLLRNGFEDYREGDGWNKFYKYDDDTFPEPVIDLNELVSMKGGKLKLLRYRLKQFSGPLEVKAYNPSIDFLNAEKLLEKWRKDIEKRYSEMLKDDDVFLHSVALHRKFMLEPIGNAFLFTSSGVPVGFSLLVQVSAQAVALYSMVCDNELDGLSERIHFETMKKAYEVDFSYCNLGGSEFESLHNYKLKFAPFTFIKKKHAVLY